MGYTLLKFLRDYLADLSQGQLARAAHVDKHYLSNAEHHGDHLCDAQAERVCEKLGWMGDPDLLRQPIGDLGFVVAHIDFDRNRRMWAEGEAGMFGRKSSRTHHGDRTYWGEALQKDGTLFLERYCDGRELALALAAAEKRDPGLGSLALRGCRMAAAAGALSAALRDGAVA